MEMYANVSGANIIRMRLPIYQLEPINFYENIVVDFSWEQSLVSSVMQG